MADHQSLCTTPPNPSTDIQLGTPKSKTLKRLPLAPVGPSIAYVPLTKGQFALIDAEDAERFGYFNWYAQWNPCTESFYAVREIPGGSKVQMHVAVLNPREGFLTDHINGHTLDNRSANLREATKAQNSLNTRLNRGNTSGYRGVYRATKCNRWYASIAIDGKRRHLGSHKTPQAAYEAYCATAAQFHAEYRRAL